MIGSTKAGKNPRHGWTRMKHGFKKQIRNPGIQEKQTRRTRTSGWQPPLPNRWNPRNPRLFLHSPRNGARNFTPLPSSHSQPGSQIFS